jgi:sarcosine oxidase subunit beta
MGTQRIVDSREELPRVADVVVIGGGIAGVCTAFYSAREGLKVVVLEKQPDLGGLTTAKSTECFRAQFNSPELIDLMLGSIAIFSRFSEEVGLPEAEIQFKQQGYLYVTTDLQQAHVNRQIVEAQHQAGLSDVELLSGDEARARFPYLCPAVISARYRAGDGWLSVHEMLHGFARGSGALYSLGTTVTGIHQDSQGVTAVSTDRGTIQTRTVVTAAGPFSGRVARMAGVELPLTLLRRHRLAVRYCGPMSPGAPFTMDDDTGVYWRPEGRGALLGRAYETDPEEPVETVRPDWAFPAMVLDPESPHSAGCVSPFWNQAPGLLAKSNIDLVAGQYTYSPDHMPILGPCPSVPGLFINTGYSGHGIMGSPEASRRLAKLLVGAASDEDNPFSFARFSSQNVVCTAREAVY